MDNEREDMRLTMTWTSILKAQPFKPLSPPRDGPRLEIRRIGQRVHGAE